MHKPFSNSQQSHEHSLEILNALYEYDDFMESVGVVADLGCGKDAFDALWWANATTRDDNPEPLNIQVVCVDQFEHIGRKHKNISYQKQDLETWNQTKRKFDVLWCHDTFQYLINPIMALSNWWQVANENAMLVIAVPQSTNLEFNQQAFDQWSGCYHNHTIVSLMHMLAVSGWDCCDGFFKKDPRDSWIYAIAYRSTHKPMNPRSTSWYNLAELGLLPASAVKSINQYGHLRQRDLTLPWIDKSLTCFGQQ